MDFIYIVSDRKLAKDRFFEIIKNVVEEGYSFIQLRENDLSAIELTNIIEKLHEITKGKIKLVINDRVDVAKIYSLYGVQLKKTSLSPTLVKKYFSDLKIGVSCHDEKRVKEYDNVADFFVYGNVFETSCKPGLEGKGLEKLRAIVSLTKKPVFAIGGITPENVIMIKKTGAYGVAVRSLVFGNKNYLEYLEKIRNLWSKNE